MTPFFDVNFSRFSKWKNGPWVNLVESSEGFSTFFIELLKFQYFDNQIPNELTEDWKFIQERLEQYPLSTLISLDKNEIKNLNFIRDDLEKEIQKKMNNYNKSSSEIQKSMDIIKKIVKEGSFKISLEEIKKKYNNLKNLMYGINFKMKHELTFLDFLGLIKSMVSNKELCESLANQLMKSTRYLSEIRKKKKERLFDLSITKSSDESPTSLDDLDESEMNFDFFESRNSKAIQLIINNQKINVDSLEKLKADNYKEEIQLEQDWEKGHRKNKSSFAFLKFILPESENTENMRKVHGNFDFRNEMSTPSDSLASTFTSSDDTEPVPATDSENTDSPRTPVPTTVDDSNTEKKVTFDLKPIESDDEDQVVYIENKRSTRGVKIIKPDEIKIRNSGIKDLPIIFDREIDYYDNEIENLEKLNETLKDMLREETMKAVDEIRKDLMILNKYDLYRDTVQKLTEIKAEVWQDANEVVVLKKKHAQIENILNNILTDEHYKNSENHIFNSEYPSEILRANLNLNNYMFYKYSQFRNKIEQKEEDDDMIKYLKKVIKEHGKHRKMLKSRDKYLAFIFSDVENSNRLNFNCFTKAQLLYMIYMFKNMGTIRDVGDFLEMLLSQISIKKSVEFMVYVYGLLANKSFMKNFTSNHKLRINSKKEKLISWQKRQEMVFYFKKRINFLLGVSEEMTMFTQASFDNDIFDQSIGYILLKHINEDIFLKILDLTNYAKFDMKNLVDPFVYENASKMEENISIVADKIDPNLNLLVKILIKDWCQIADFLMNVPYLASSVGKMFSYVENYLWELLVTRFHTPAFIMHTFTRDLEKCKERYYRIYQVEQNYIDLIEDKVSEKDILDTGINLREISNRSRSENSNDQARIPNLQDTSNFGKDESESSADSKQINPAEFLMIPKDDISQQVMNEGVPVIVTKDSESSSAMQVEKEQLKSQSQAFQSMKDSVTDETLNKENSSQATRSMISETTSMDKSDRDSESDDTENNFMEWNSITFGSDEDQRWQNMPKPVFSRRM